MNYSYEILKAEPKHKFLTVRYFADGQDDFFKNFITVDWTTEAITNLIENHAQFVLAHWEYQETASNTSPIEVGTIVSSNTEPHVPATSGELTDEEKATILREDRNLRLRQTDFYALSDNTLSAEMQTYRQALRDVPLQNTFPSTVSWPTKPV